MDTFRILHLSDLHFGLPARNIGFPDILSAWDFHDARHELLTPASYDPNLAERLARQVSILKTMPLDAILVSGDLATNGNGPDLSLATDYILNPVVDSGWLNSNQNPSIFHSSSVPVMVMPGNHDRFQGPAYFPGGTNFDAAFKGKWDGTRKAQTLAVFQGANSERLAIIAADFCLLDGQPLQMILSLNYMGQGRVDAAVLQSLIEETVSIRNQYGDIAVVWAIHFPPEFPGINEKLKLLDETRLSTAAVQQRVACLLTGHTHQPAEYHTASGCEVHCAGTATQYYAPDINTFHLREFAVTGAKAVCGSTDFQWNQDENDFLPK